MKTLTEKTGRLPTAPVMAARLALYQSTRRPKHITSDWVITPWGRCRVQGALGQRHADIMECLMHVSDSPVWRPDGSLLLLVDPYRLKKALGGAGHNWLVDKLREIMTTLLDWECGEIRGTGHIISSFRCAKKSRPNPLTGEDRPLWAIVLTPEWVRVLEADLCVYYDPTPIAKIKCGVSQRIARMALTHGPGSATGVETMLDQIGLTGQARRNARRRLAQHARHLLDCGVDIAGGLVRRVTRSRD